MWLQAGGPDPCASTRDLAWRCLGGRILSGGLASIRLDLHAPPGCCPPRTWPRRAWVGVALGVTAHCVRTTGRRCASSPAPRCASTRVPSSGRRVITMLRRALSGVHRGGGRARQPRDAFPRSPPATRRFAPPSPTVDARPHRAPSSYSCAQANGRTGPAAPDSLRWTQTRTLSSGPIAARTRSRDARSASRWSRGRHAAAKPLSTGTGGRTPFDRPRDRRWTELEHDLVEFSNSALRRRPRHRRQRARDDRATASWSAQGAWGIALHLPPGRSKGDAGVGARARRGRAPPGCVYWSTWGRIQCCELDTDE